MLDWVGLGIVNFGTAYLVSSQTHLVGPTKLVLQLYTSYVTWFWDPISNVSKTHASVSRGFSIVGLCDFLLCFKSNSQKISRHIDTWVFGTEDPASLIWGLISHVPKTLVPRDLLAVGLCDFLLYFKFNNQETSRH